MCRLLLSMSASLSSQVMTHLSFLAVLFDLVIVYYFLWISSYLGCERVLENGVKKSRGGQEITLASGCLEV